MPDDAIGHYRHLFDYDTLKDLWIQSGCSPEFEVVSDPYVYTIVADPVDDHFEFILRHGLLLPDWIKPVVAPGTDVALIVSGTGSGKTSGVAIAALAYCLMYPGFEFMNIAPSEKQAKLIMAELDKWAGGSRFRDFVQITSRSKLYTEKPYALATIVSPLDPRYPSHFACQTIGVQSADQILGESKDWFNIDECQLVADLEGVIPKVVTRSRAQRPDGSNRWTKLTMLTNPADDPGRAANIDLARKKIEAIQENPGEYGAIIKAMYQDSIVSGANLYVTKKQQAFHRSMMDAADQQRWLDGNTDIISDVGEIPAKLIKANVDPVMDDEIRVKNLHQVVKRSGMGIISYRVPREEGRYYLVTGDPGKNNAIKKSYNNVPVVTVFDVTGFPFEPLKMVAFHMLDGAGSYKPWLNTFKREMLYYRAPGYYDATNLGVTGAEDFGAFDGGQIEVDGKTYNLNSSFRTTPITFANNNKRWARSAFIMLLQDGMFAWPEIECLIYQASIYAESGPGVKKLADDILASIFVLGMAFRIDGVLWSKFLERYHIDYEEARDEPLITHSDDFRPEDVLVEEDEMSGVVRQSYPHHERGVR